jgi:hypothetical protein
MPIFGWEWIISISSSPDPPGVEMFQTGSRCRINCRPPSPITPPGFLQRGHFQGNRNATSRKAGVFIAVIINTSQRMLHLGWSARHKSRINVATQPLRQRAEILLCCVQSREIGVAAAILECDTSNLAPAPTELQRTRSRCADHNSVRPDSRQATCSEVSRIAEPTFDAR